MVADLCGRTVVATYSTDFNSSGTPNAGWSYLWNAPIGWSLGVTGDQSTGFIGTPSQYRAMMLASYSYFADGDTSGTNNAPAGFARLSATGGHPGPAAGSTNKRPRYAIAAYTAPVAGLYAIENSFISIASATSDGVEVLVLPGKSEAVLRHTARSGTSSSFDVEIGYLDAGQIIYVAFGPGATANSDAFQMDFSIVRYERQSFREQLLSGITSGASVVTLTPGRYYANPTSSYVTVSNYRPSTPVTIVMDGVELINQSLHRAVGFVNCNNLNLRGLSIDYDPQLYRQGTVESINGSSFQVRLHEGYPQTLSNQATSGIIYEPGTLRMKQLTNTIYPPETNTTELLPESEGGLFTYTSNSLVANLAVGDYVAFTEPVGIPHTFYLEKCQDIRVEDVSIHGSPAFAFLCLESERITLDGVKVVPGKTPLRATVPRLLSSNADGLHFKHAHGQIRIINSTLTYNGDDCIVLTASYAPIIQKPAANTVVVALKAAQETLSVGDKLYLYNPTTGARESATIQAVGQVTSLNRQQIWDLIRPLFPEARLQGTNFSRAFQVTLSNVVTTPVGGWFGNRNGDSSDFEIADNRIENTRARGILIKASNGIVRNNTLSNTLLAGIQLRPEPVIWMEGDFAENVVIQDNELSRCAIGRSNANAPINITSEGFEQWIPGSGHQNISIVRNKFFDSPSASIYVQFADNVVIRSNQFTTTHNLLGQTPRFGSVIELRNVHNVEIQGLNTAMEINRTNANLNALVGIGSKVTGLTVNAGILVSSDQDLLPDTWEFLHYGGTTAASATADTDGDGMTSYQEYLAETNPLLPDATAIELEMGQSPTLRWKPINHRFITVYSTESLESPFTEIANEIRSEQGFHHVPAMPPGGRIFYRIGITD